MGAHGHTHAILTRETKAAAFESIEKSIARVSEEIGDPCSSFAFPNGNYTAELAQHAIRCGAKTIMTTEPLWVDEGFALWRLPRLQFFGDDSPGKIKLKAAVAATGLFLKNPDGTKHAYRRMHRVARRGGRQDLMQTKIDQVRSTSRTQTEVGVNASLD
jgi:Polysaccharide deacetylase